VSGLPSLLQTDSALLTHEFTMELRVSEEDLRDDMLLNYFSLLLLCDRRTVQFVYEMM
jgi:hypothetical protein